METRPDALILACDIDDTLAPMDFHPDSVRAAGSVALEKLCTTIIEAREQSDIPIYFGTVTGRRLSSHQERQTEVPAFAAAVSVMDFMVTGVGTESHIRTPDGFVPTPGWPPEDPAWDRDRIFEALSSRAELAPQPDFAQGEYKISFDVTGTPDSDHDAYVSEVNAHLAKLSLAGQVVFSMGMYLDVLPRGVDKGSGLLHTARALASNPYIIASGDSMNDKDMLQFADLAVLPNNAGESLRQWAQTEILSKRLYVAQADYAAGVLEGFDEARRRLSC